MMNEGSELREKKLRGSGGYAMAKVTDEEQKMGNLGGPELFLAGIGRLEEDRFSKYYCNRCEKEFDKSPSIVYDNPNEELGEGVTLIEKGEYKCKACNNTIAQYRKFNTEETNSSDESSAITDSGSAQQDLQQQDLQQQDQQEAVEPTEAHLSESTEYGREQQNQHIQAAEANRSAELQENRAKTTKEGFIPITNLVGMPAYDSEAMFVGKVQQIGLRRKGGRAEINIIIERNDGNGSQTSREISWGGISKIGDILLLLPTSTAEPSGKKNNASANLSSGGSSSNSSSGNSDDGSLAQVTCPSCGHNNEEGATFCEECGKRM